MAAPQEKRAGGDPEGVGTRGVGRAGAGSRRAAGPAELARANSPGGGGKSRE